MLIWVIKIDIKMLVVILQLSIHFPNPLSYLILQQMEVVMNVLG
jgi:hypothetical protein